MTSKIILIQFHGIDDRLQIVAPAIKKKVDAGPSQEDIAKPLQFFANELRGLG
jgi:hypothetical protein